ncbi:MAG: HEAT repeat domain-containing protein [Bryobacteraceae bacterium]
MTRTLLVMALACAASAQAPHIANINFYGLHRVTAEKIRQAGRIEPGGGLPPSKGELEDQLATIPGVVAVRVEAVCCDGNATDLFIGIEEQGAPHAAFRSPPSGTTSMPQDLLDLYQEFLGAVQRAAVKGAADEDMTAGHAIMADPAVSAIQQKFIDFAAVHLDLLRDELRTGSVPEERAVAAMVIGYAPRKLDVVNDLQFAIDDPDEAVRANAMKSLAAIAVMAHQQPGFGIKIAPTWLVEMLNSVVLSDRVEATRALLTLTDGGNPAALDLVRERALASLVEMARWKTLRYALPPFLLLGRVAGISDAQTRQDWEKGDREAVIEKAGSAPRNRKR